MDWGPVLTAGIGVLGGGALGAVGKTLIDNRRLSGEQRIAEGDQPIRQYREMVDRMESRIISLEKSHADCMREHAEQRFEMGKLYGMLSEQREAMVHLRETSAKTAIHAVERAGAVAAESVKTAAVASAEAVKVAAELAAASDSTTRTAKMVDKENPLPATVVEDRTVHE